MTIPSVVFLDTSVLDGVAYNFDAPRMRAFSEAAKAERLSLVVPDPTAREIRRHLRERAKRAAEQLRDILRHAPFVARWSRWPAIPDALPHELGWIALKEWRAFCDGFAAVKQLDYEGINVSQIMNWYERGDGPFGKARKKNEFPDALALAILLKFSRDHDCDIAVVSSDDDLRRACVAQPRLHYFSSIDALTEQLLGQPERVELLHRLLEPTLAGEDDRILNAVRDAFAELAFYPADHFEGEAEDPEADEIVVEQLDVIAVGERDFTAALVVTVTYFVRVTIPNPDDWFQPADPVTGRVQDRCELTGVVKLSLAPDGQALASVEMIQFDDDHVIVNAVPSEY